jgi:uncharacterized protein YqeY
MTLLEKIEKELNESLKNKDQKTRSVLGMLKSAIHNQEIEKKEPLAEEEIQAIVAKQVKLRQDAQEEYLKANRPELAQKEKEEIEILQKYLAQPFSENELITMIDQTIKDTQVNSPQDMGKVMGLLMPKIRGRADGQWVSQKVKEKLSQI